MNDLLFLSGIDFSMLTMANHSIMTYGTFGMWGALFAGGLITLPRFKCYQYLKCCCFAETISL
jgi:hypothetical protein